MWTYRYPKPEMWLNTNENGIILVSWFNTKTKGTVTLSNFKQQAARHVAGAIYCGEEDGSGDVWA